MAMDHFTVPTEMQLHRQQTVIIVVLNVLLNIAITTNFVAFLVHFEIMYAAL